MNKFYTGLFLLVVAFFAGVFYLTQGYSLSKSSTLINPVPTLPEDADKLQVISRSPVQQALGAETTNDQANQQTIGQVVQTNQVQQNTATNVAPTFGVEEGIKASYSALIKTSKGDIELILNGKDAPNTVKNFIYKAKSGYYNGLIFHRVEDWVIQGGDPKGNGTGGGLMQTELNQTPFVSGSLGVARGADIRVSNDSQFFITKSDASWLNGQYTNFGAVRNGMDVVGKIEIGDKILGITVE